MHYHHYHHYNHYHDDYHYHYYRVTTTTTAMAVTAVDVRLGSSLSKPFCSTLSGGVALAAFSHARLGAEIPLKLCSLPHQSAWAPRGPQ